MADSVNAAQPAGPLPSLVREIDEHTAAGGWDQPARLYALVSTRTLLDNEPHLAALIDGSVAGELTPVEQDELPEHASLEELLAGIGWPADVVGAALAVERVVLPADAESDLPGDEAAALAAAAGHPLRQEVRLVVAVLRDGSRHSALRFRAHDSPAEVLTGPDLVPGLADALASTLVD